MYNENNPIPPTLERNGVTELTPRSEQLLKRAEENIKGMKHNIDLITIGDGLRNLKGNNLLVFAIKEGLKKKKLIDLIAELQDFAKDNPMLTKNLLGGNLYKTITNFK